MTIQRYRLALAEQNEITADGMKRDRNGKFVKFADYEREVAELKQLLREFYKNTGIIDNGYCAVCKHGYRKWKLPKCDVPAGPCSNEECLSRRTDEVLGRASQ